MVVCPIEQWNYENLAPKTMQEIALTFQQVFKLFTFSLFVAGIRLFHSSKLRNLNISYLYLVFEFKCLLLSFCSASLGNRRNIIPTTLMTPNKPAVIATVFLSYWYKRKRRLEIN